MPKGPVETPITNQEIAFAHLLLAGKLTDQAAAEAVGFNANQAAYIKGKSRVKKYMAEHRASVAAAMVERESEVLAQYNISRQQIMVQYWTWATLPPDKTNGNITGQVKALDSLREMVGFKSESEQPPEREEPDIYVPRWMRKREDQDREEEPHTGYPPPAKETAPNIVQSIRSEAPPSEDHQSRTAINGIRPASGMRHLPRDDPRRF